MFWTPPLQTMPASGGIAAHRYSSTNLRTNASAPKSRGNTLMAQPVFRKTTAYGLRAAVG
jgi:hypothetical protein